MASINIHNLQRYKIERLTLQGDPKGDELHWALIRKDSHVTKRDSCWTPNETPTKPAKGAKDVAQVLAEEFSGRISISCRCRPKSASKAPSAGSIACHTI